MSEEDRRKGTRVPAEVKVDYRTVGSFITDYSKDLSQGGIFVQTSLPLAVDQRVRLRITLPGRELPFALDGVVRWVRSPQDSESPGMGVEFEEFDEATREALRRFVESLNGERGR